MSHRMKKKDRTKILTGLAFCPKCQKKTPYTLHKDYLKQTADIYGMDEVIDYIHYSGTCNICGQPIATKKMRELENKSVRVAKRAKRLEAVENGRVTFDSPQEE